MDGTYTETRHIATGDPILHDLTGERLGTVTWISRDQDGRYRIQIDDRMHSRVDGALKWRTA